MMCWQEFIDNFLKINNAECRNRFNEEIYDSIKDEEDKNFYKWSSCIPVLIISPIPTPCGEKVHKLYIHCTNYEPSSGHFCRNPHHRINQHLQEKFDQLEQPVSITDLAELLNSEVTCD
jgi:hypothetical protein